MGIKEEKAPFTVRVLIIIVFFLLAASAFTWFIYAGLNLTVALYKLSPVIEFDKSAMYSLGGSIGFFFMLVGMVLQGILEKDLSKNTESLLTKGMLAGVAIMFVFPQVVDYTISEIIPKDQYMVCEPMSYQWMASKKTVYTDSQATCDELDRQNEIRLSKPWF